MISSTSAVLRFAVQRLMSYSITILMSSSFQNYDLSSFLVGHYIDALGNDCPNFPSSHSLRRRCRTISGRWTSCQWAYPRSRGGNGGPFRILERHQGLSPLTRG